MRAAKFQASLRIPAVSPEPSLLAHTSSESRGTFRQKARSLAPLNGWACAVKVCHDGMLEDTNSLDGAQIQTIQTMIRHPKLCIWSGSTDFVKVLFNVLLGINQLINMTLHLFNMGRGKSLNLHLTKFTSRSPYLYFSTNKQNCGNFTLGIMLLLAIYCIWYLSQIFWARSRYKKPMGGLKNSPTDPKCSISWNSDQYRKNPKNLDTCKIAVTILKFVPCGFTVEYCVQMMPKKWQTV